MTQLNHLFVVYDPTREEQPALARASNIASDISATLHIFACIHADVSDCEDKLAAVNALLAKQRDTLNQEANRLRAQGIETSTEVEWDRDWYHAVVRASIKCNADMVLKSYYQHSHGKRVLNRTSDWTLIRQCLCPVMLVKEGEPRKAPRVLAAIDICAKNATYEKLNQKVIDFGNRVLAHDNRDAEIHYINAFQDYRGFPDRQELIRSCGIPGDNIHIKLGSPPKVIVEQARALDASLVVLGNSARSGLTGAIVGNTVEKVLDKVDCDVLSLP